MISLFAIPKPFRGEAALIQRNALRSWTLLGREVEIILFGDDDGTGEVAQEFDTLHVPEVARSEYGTPLVNDVFAAVQARAAADVLCYVNADIVLLDDFVPAVERVAGWRRRFLLSGCRREARAEEVAGIGRPGWVGRLRRHARSAAPLSPPWAMDYFVFTRRSLGAIPPFAVGRPGWDNWMVYRALTRGVPVVDATEAITAVHQAHGYGHVPAGTGQRWEGPEAERNRRLMGRADLRGGGPSFCLLDASWVLTVDGLSRPVWDQQRRRRYVMTLPAVRPQLRPLMPLVLGLCRAVPSRLWRMLAGAR